MSAKVWEHPRKPLIDRLKRGSDDRPERHSGQVPLLFAELHNRNFMAPIANVNSLSYGAQDADAARRNCTAWRAAGLDVWIEPYECRGGDAWGAPIRRQIKDRAAFVPINSGPVLRLLMDDPHYNEPINPPPRL